MWTFVVGFNALIALCYIAIASLVLRGLVRTHQLRTNPLALATAAIFLSCALHHGAHTVLLLSPAAADSMHLQDMRAMMGTWPYVVIDGIGAVVAVIYLSLRRSYGALLGAPSMFSDVADMAYRQLAANLPHTSVFVVDRDLRYTVAEGTGRAETGINAAAVVGRHPSEVLSPEVWARLEPHYRGAAEGTTSEFDLAMDAGVVFNVRAVPMRGQDDAFIGALIVAENVSEQRAAVNRRNEALAFTEAVLAASPDMTMIVDLESGSMVWSSGKLSAALPWADTAAGEEVELLSRVVPEDLDDVRGADAALAMLADGESISTRFRVLNANGEKSWVARRATPFGRGEDGVPRQALCVVRDVTQLVESEQRLQHAAMHDPLTDLPNRALLLELVSAAAARHRRDGIPVVLLFCDLDGFKSINDTHGHSVGDALLVEVAHRLHGVMRPGDSVARVGGDEFVVIVEPSPERGHESLPEQAVGDIAERIRRAVARPIEHGPLQLSVTMSVGVARVLPGASAADTLRDADAAMYRAKQRGKNRVELFDEALQSGISERRHVEATLRQALAASAQEGAQQGARLTVAYQPVFDLTDGRLVSLEALARLDDSAGEPIAPDRFIPVSEETGLIHQLGERVLELSLATLVDLRVQNTVTDQVTMAVNLSASQAQHANLPIWICAALDRHRLAPCNLVIEITESVLVDSGSSTLRQFTELHDLGVGIAIDDFGTGYTSLRYLATLPVDSVKVDRSFTAGLCVNPTDAAILRAIAALAKQLGMSCVVEGVESDDQLAALPPGVLGQGYLLGRPGPIPSPPGPLPPFPRQRLTQAAPSTTSTAG